MESSTSGLSGSGELVKRGSLESAEEYNKVGREYYSQKNYVAATEQFGHAIKIYPAPKYYNNRALSRMKEEKWKESLQDAEVVIEHDCSNPDDKLKAFLRAGECLMSTSNYSAALTRLYQALELRKTREVQGKIKDVSSRMRFDLIAGGAVHISQTKDLDLLDDMVASWACQTHPVPLYLSLSANPIHETDLAQKNSQLRSRYPSQLYLFPRSVRLSQFQHYKLLADFWSGTLPDGGRNTFVLFTDGDDLWHPSRTATYADSINKAVIESAQRGQILSRITFDGFLMGRDNDHHIRTADDADASIRDRHLKIEIQDSEYWQNAVPFKILSTFVREAPDQVLQHSLADMYFYHYLTSFGRNLGSHAKLESEGQHWLYFYREHGDSARSYACPVPDTTFNELCEILQDYSDLDREPLLRVIVHNYILALARGQGPAPWDSIASKLPDDNARAAAKVIPRLRETDWCKCMTWTFTTTSRSIKFLYE